MLRRHFTAALFAALAAGSLAVAAQQKVTPQNVDDIYPKAYVCKDTQQTQVDDKPGKCTKDGTDLIPIRLGTVFKCLRGPAEYQTEPGPCRTTPGQPKGAVTASIFWTCGNEKFLEPGKCGSGERQIGFEERPHGDHNPRHGGPSIYMNSENLNYHVEGTYSNGLFRAYFYNEFTKPLKITGMTGRVALANNNDVRTGTPVPLTPAPIADGNALEARIPAPVPTKDAPVHFWLSITLKPGAKEWITNPVFTAPSVDPDPPAPARGGGASTTGAARATQPPATSGRGNPSQTPAGTTARAATPRPAAPATPKPAGPSAAAPPKTAASATPPAPAAPPAAASTPDVAPPSGTVMAGGAEVSGGPTGVQVVLPSGIPALLAFIKENSASVSQLLGEGQLGGMWYPALNAKDAGLELDDKYTSGLNAAQKGQLASAVKQLTVVAWQIDAAGDLGNAEQLHVLRDQFDAAVKDVLAVYGQQ